MLEFLIIEEFGFKKEEVDVIESHFTFSIDYYDWDSIVIYNSKDLEGDDVEDCENFLKLPTGRVAYFPDDLLRKEFNAQID